MAITKPTPKDVGNYEAKMMGPFTQRQVICVAAGALPSVFIGTAMSTSGISADIIIFTCMLLMIGPCFLAFGSVLCYGMKPEDFAIEYLQYHKKSKNIRLYETCTMDDKLDIVRRKEKEMEAKKLGIEEEKAPKKKKKDVPVTKTKYKDSRFTSYGHVDSKEYKAFC